MLFLLTIITLGTAQTLDSATADQMEKCDEAIERGKSDLYQESNRLASEASRSPTASVETSSNQIISTGNPMVDMITRISNNNQEMARIQQEKLQAQSQVETDCFQQSIDLEDKAHDIRQKEYERLRQVNLAEGEQKKQEADVRISCWKEASNLFLAEMENLKNYARRIVSTVSGATRSKNDVNSLRTRFYNECMASGPAREALLSVKNDLDTKMRNIAITSQELASDLDYYENTKMQKLSSYCELRSERIDAQFLPMRNAIFQNQAINLPAFSMAMKTSSVSADSQEKVYNSYSSIKNILDPENWRKLVERCANQSQNTTNVSEVDSVPADVFAILQPINQACRPLGSASLNCLTSSGVNSYERQIRDRPLNSTQ